MSDDLARRAVASKHWRWAPGMLTQHGRICGAGYLVSDDIDEGGQPFVDCTDTIDDWSNLTPDLSDPATLGCLLALVRETAQEPGLHVRCMLPYAPDMSGKTPPPWVLYSGRGQRWGDRHDTEAAALVAALEAAP